MGKKMTLKRVSKPVKQVAAEIETAKVSCDYCDELLEQDDALENTAGTFHVECFNDNYFTCARCNKPFENDEANELESELYCERCFDYLGCSCSECGDTMPNDEANTTGNGDIVCNNCFSDNYFSCDSCGDVFPNDDYSDNGECINCAPQDSDSIHDYSYMPRRLCFEKMAWENTLFQGVELEIELREEESRSRHADRFNEFLVKEGMAKYIYLKDDGSISNGYEIVSHPFTPMARHKKLNWYKVLKHLKETGATNKDSDGNFTAGLHIHVSKDALSVTDMWKLKLFFSCHKDKIEKIAGREGNNYCRYEAFSLMKFKEALRREYMPESDDRFVAVNVNSGGRKRTVEFRCFRATLDHGEFLGRLQFTEAICEFVKVHGAPKIAGRDGFKTFKAWLKERNKWTVLEKLMRKVRV